MKLAPKVEKILEHASKGNGISKDDALYLMKEVAIDSPEFYALMSTAHQLNRDFIGKHGLIFEQIGINFEPCPRNCKFCSMGEKWGTVKVPSRLSKEEVVERAVDS